MRSLVNKPDLVLADEPSGNLDSKQSIKMFQLFNKLRDQFSTTFLIITHNNNLLTWYEPDIGTAEAQSR